MHSIHQTRSQASVGLLHCRDCRNVARRKDRWQPKSNDQACRKHIEQVGVWQWHTCQEHQSHRQQGHSAGQDPLEAQTPQRFGQDQKGHHNTQQGDGQDP